MNRRIDRISPWLTLSGVAILLLGLTWDAALNAADPELAAEEGIFTLSNPGHVLFALGIALVIAGSLGFLYGRYAISRGRLALVPIAGLLALGSVSFVSAMSVEWGLGGGGHSHADDDSDHGASADTEAHSDPEGDDGDHLHSDESSVATEDQLGDADAFRAEAVAAIERFADFSVAEAEGYIPSQPQTVARSTSEIPGIRATARCSTWRTRKRWCTC
jgi:hypothetical protein